MDLKDDTSAADDTSITRHGYKGSADDRRNRDERGGQIVATCIAT